MTIDKVKALVFSSTRSMPAHFTSYNNRTQTFCISSELINANDEYNMASQAWDDASALSENDSDLSRDDIVYAIKIGEDIMIGAYILSKMNGGAYVNELTKQIIEDNMLMLKNTPHNISLETNNETVKKYFKGCEEFGRQIALQK